MTKRADLQIGLNGTKLFQRSYYDHVIRNKQDYDEIWQHIENNPRKWAINNQKYGEWEAHPHLVKKPSKTQK